jgi:hypothetical protein
MLFDPQDLKDYLGPSVTVNDDQAVIYDQVVTALIEAELGYDPSPSDDPITVRYFQHGNTLTVATATIQTSGWLEWVNDRTVDVTYTYTTAPGPLQAAALLTAATMSLANGSSVGGGSTVGVKSEQIDDYQVAYADASTLFGPSGLPAQALALLRPYRRVGRSVKLRA